jgi:hypothetical protein
MLHMCVYMNSLFIENHLIQILEDGPLISEVVLSHISSIKLELSKLNKFFDRDAKASLSTLSGVLLLESSAATSSLSDQADVPNGHCVPHSNQDCGIGHANTQFHDPVTGTVSSPPPHPQSLVHPQLTLGSDFTNGCPNPNCNARLSMGRLPKIDSPKFDGENPKLWQSRCEIYFEMYSVEPQIWVRVATMCFVGAAARWL